MAEVNDILTHTLRYESITRMSRTACICCTREDNKVLRVCSSCSSALAVKRSCTGTAASLIQGRKRASTACCRRDANSVINGVVDGCWLHAEVQASSRVVHSAVLMLIGGGGGGAAVLVGSSVLRRLNTKPAVSTVSQPSDQMVVCKYWCCVEGRCSHHSNAVP